MTSQSLAAPATRLYARALRLYPRRFKDAFADSMLEDFIDASADAAGAGAGALISLWCRAGVDLAWSVASQWIQRPQPWCAVMAVASAGLIVQALAWLAPRPPADLPVQAADEQAMLVILMLVTALFPVVAVILFVPWFLTRARRRGRRRA